MGDGSLLEDSFRRVSAMIFSKETSPTFRDSFLMKPSIPPASRMWYPPVVRWSCSSSGALSLEDYDVGISERFTRNFAGTEVFIDARSQGDGVVGFQN